MLWCCTTVTFMALIRSNLWLMCVYVRVCLTGMCIKTCVRLSWRVTLRRMWIAGRLHSSELVFTRRKTRYTRVCLHFKSCSLFTSCIYRGVQRFLKCFFKDAQHTVAYVLSESLVVCIYLDKISLWTFLPCSTTTFCSTVHSIH